MSIKKILYFIAGTEPTVNEAAQIALLENLVNQGYSLAVRSALKPATFADADNIEPADYVVGSVPASHEAIDVYSLEKPALLAIVPSTVSLAAEADKTITVQGIFGSFLEDLEIEDLTADERIAIVSSNTGKATISNGTVHGVAAGSATLTATFTGEDGSEATATCAVTVTN